MPNEIISGKITKYFTESGTSGGNPWTRYVVEFGEKKYGTFDTALGLTLERAQKGNIEVELELEQNAKNPKYWNIVEVKPLSALPPAPAPAPATAPAPAPAPAPARKTVLSTDASIRRQVALKCAVRGMVSLTPAVDAEAAKKWVVQTTGVAGEFEKWLNR